LLLPAPADPLLHPLAGLRAGPKLTSTRRSSLVGGIVAGLTLVVVTSCGAALSGTTASNWWDTTGGVSACGTPASYRVDAGPSQEVGSCAGIFVIPPAHVIVAVGSEVDVHLAQEGSGPSGDELVPIYPTPWSDNTTVLESEIVSDGGATESFIAVGPGTANVTTQAFCLVSGATTDPAKPCPVLEVGVS
jgi:hypothetical protein